MTLILSLHSGPHDSAAALFNDYELLSAVHQERLTRKKTDGGYPREAVDEVLRVAGKRKEEIEQIVMSHGSWPVRWQKFSPLRRLAFALQRKKGKERHKNIGTVMAARDAGSAHEVWLHEKFLRQEGFPAGVPVYFANHHNAHALSAFFYMPGREDVLLYTADGGGDGVYYSARTYQQGELKCLFGDSPAPTHINSLGLAYGYCTKICGFRMNRHEGKLTGLAAYGQPTLAEPLGALFRLERDGQISTDFTTTRQMEQAIVAICEGENRENIAASIQQVLEEKITAAVSLLVKTHGLKRLALAGGVFANVRLNACLGAIEGVEEVFIFPAMGDDGLPVGGALEYLMQRDWVQAWLGQRAELMDVYLGGRYGDVNDLFLADTRISKISDHPVEHTAKLLANGKVGAIFTQAMEYGPRALGARTILASPAKSEVNQTINDRLNRSEFMPFAPYVLTEDAEAVFEIDDRNRYACRFMTTTAQVKPEWRERIPAVVHVDNTARPQIIERASNPLYADILSAFKKESGLPVLVNTSFNAHEEPIIDTPQQALNALLTDRVDFLVTEQGVYEVDRF
jgi:carbamoyltransferase